MTQLAIEQEPAFKVILNESTEKKIFTYNTLLELQNDEANKNISFTLLLSEDLLEKLHTWHNIDLLINKFELFIASRKCHKKLDISSISKYHLSKIKGAICPIRTLEISSRDIRDRLKKKLCCTHLVPGKVLDYIYENELY
ncbi:MAG: putative nicotinate-nucleotide adenylyltransferase [Chlamydiae bacterium]|nr:putative nicotinate-nucleotide adenylyltransferase [Chlamydiota bacterium]